MFGKMPISSVEFRDALHQLFATATQTGKTSVTVNAGEFHRRLGEYPDPQKHRMNALCTVMLGEYSSKIGDFVLDKPAKGKGAILTIRYSLPRVRRKRR